MIEEIKIWLVKWFLENTDAESSDIEKNLSHNYFELGWIDSLKFINFITDIEDRFNIYFSNDEFQNREFATIEGIVKIIEGKLI